MVRWEAAVPYPGEPTTNPREKPCMMMMRGLHRSMMTGREYGGRGTGKRAWELGRKNWWCLPPPTIEVCCGGRVRWVASDTEGAGLEVGE